ncbi:hypothetical protein ATL41_2052 [Flavimobilis soli]|uniref:Integral membrane protein n=1 Tax=Flavimobilis soli TaxID=442709 RepID=A0A2A9EE30_9MICO|nr:hypothetical protein [Flavimobilis soli]PFG37297.1 hypothetical protein ATL41_2052 [Flavimobilis soli]
MRTVARRVLVVVLVAAAVLGVPGTLAAGWAHRVVGDPDSYASAMSQIADDDELRSVASAEVSGRLLDAVDVESVVRRSLDATLGPARDGDRVREALVATSTSFLQATVRDGVESAVGSSAASATWDRANRAMHAGLRWVLTTGAPSSAGGAGVAGVSATGEVLLDLGAVADQVVARLEAERLPVPDALRSVDLTVVVLDREEVAQVRTAYRWAEVARLWGWFAVVLAAAVALALSRRRGAVGVVLGGGVVLACATARALAGTVPAVLQRSVDAPESLGGLVVARGGEVLADSLRGALVPGLWGGGAALLAAACVVALGRAPWSLSGRGRPRSRGTR